MKALTSSVILGGGDSNMDVFNINDLIYKVNINTTSDTSNQQTMEYKDVLDKIRHIISKNHSAELIDVIYSPSAGDKLKKSHNPLS